MSNSIVVIGGGGHALSLISIIKRDGIFNLKGYTDIVDKGDIVGVKYFGNENLLDLNYTSNLVMGISYLKSPTDVNLRLNLIKKFSNLGYNFPSIVSKLAVINFEVFLNIGTCIFDNVVINSKTSIGEHTVINSGAIIEHGCKIGDNCFIGPGAVICGDAEISDNVFIGAGCVVRDAIKILEGVVLALGSVVVKDIQKPGIYAGNPAKLIKI